MLIVLDVAVQTPDVAEQTPDVAGRAPDVAGQAPYAEGLARPQSSCSPVRRELAKASRIRDLRSRSIDSKLVYNSAVILFLNYRHRRVIKCCPESLTEGYARERI